MLVWSLTYKNLWTRYIQCHSMQGFPLTPTIPFDARQGTIVHTDGRVTGMVGMYCAGWIKRGPNGVVLTTMNDAFATAATLLGDIEWVTSHCTAWDTLQYSTQFDTSRQLVSSNPTAAGLESILPQLTQENVNVSNVKILRYECVKLQYSRVYI